VQLEGLELKQLGMTQRVVGGQVIEVEQVGYMGTWVRLRMKGACKTRRDSY
jgi:hypothetical protein